MGFVIPKKLFGSLQLPWEHSCAVLEHSPLQHATDQTALARQDFSCTYLAHEVESIVVTIMTTLQRCSQFCICAAGTVLGTNSCRGWSVFSHGLPEWYRRPRPAAASDTHHQVRWVHLQLCCQPDCRHRGSIGSHGRLHCISHRLLGVRYE